MITIRTLGSILALLVSVGVAHAQSAQAPTLSVGDAWKRSNGVEITVVKVEDDAYVFKGYRLECPACLTRFDKQMSIVAEADADGKPLDPTRVQSMFVGSNWRFWDWPLEVNKNWTASGVRVWNGSPQNINVDIRVKSYEDVKTKAGVFKAFKIEHQFTGRGAGLDRPFSWTNTIWYAPDAKWVVKGISTSTGSQDWELVSYSLK